MLGQAARPGAADSTAVIVSKLTKKFSVPGAESQFTVLDSMSLTVEEGKFISIVGPSGCGKSTLLNIIAGIESYDDGSVTVFPRAGTASHEPRVAYVFQSPRLLRHARVHRTSSALEASAYLGPCRGGIVKMDDEIDG